MSGKRHAILIASSKFPEEPGLTELRCPENDVDALNEVLASPDFGQFNKVIALKNRPSHEVLEQLEMLLHEAGREDLVLVYFSGHGKLNGPQQQLCLTTVNTKLKVLGSTSIPIERIKSFFDAASTKKKILILDCCNSGAAGEAFTGTKGSFLDQLQLMSQGQGTFIVTASAKFQIAEEKPGDSLGLFTKHLVEGIRSGEADRDEDGLVDIHELYDHVYERVRAEGAQEPMKWDIHAKGRMIVAKSGRVAKEKLRANQQEADKDDRDTPSNKKNLWNWLHRVFLIFIGGIIGSFGWWSLKQLESRPDPQQSASSSPEEKKAEALPAAVVQPTSGLPSASVALPKMAVVSVRRQTVPSLSQTKLQPLPKGMSKKGRTIGQYIDHGDGTVTDTKSGLMWKRCLEGLSGVKCEEGKAEKYKWDDAVKRFKNVAYAGYADWRLPTIDELKTLMQCSKGKDKDGDCNEGSEEPVINQQAFPNSEESVVWSGSPVAFDSSSSWYVLFKYYGQSNFYRRNYSYAVRLVRGGQ